MKSEEVIGFKQHRFFDDIIKVRVWDEMAKNSEAILHPLSHFRTLIYEYLNDKN